MTNEPSPAEIRNAFTGIAGADAPYYRSMSLNDFLLGYCMARGMGATEALDYVERNPVVED